jgi:hypothetical protein
MRTIVAGRSSSGRKAGRLAAALGVILAIGALSVQPAAAEEDHRQGQEQHRPQQYHPAPGHQGDRHDERSRPGYAPRGYYAPPPVVYAPAPVYYAPPVSPGISLIIPFSFH